MKQAQTRNSYTSVFYAIDGVHASHVILAPLP